MKENSDSLNDIKVRGIRHIAFEVNNIKESISKLKKLKFSKPKIGVSGHYFSYSKDPNGVVLELFEK